MSVRVQQPKGIPPLAYRLDLLVSDGQFLIVVVGGLDL